MKTQMHNTLLKKQVKQQGISLVELMVAMVLGLIMTAAVMQTYLGTKQTYNITNGISRLQENARFGHYFITKDLREAGNRGCLTSIRNMLTVHPPIDFLSFLKPVSGWEFSGTARDDTYTIPATLDTPSTGWSGDGAFPDFLEGDAIAGSDVLSFKTYDKLDVLIDGNNTNNINSSSVGTVGAHNLPIDAVLLMGDCLRADLFQHTEQGNNASALTATASGQHAPGNVSLSNPVWSKQHGYESKIYSLITTYYFVQQGASGLPSLFRLRSAENPPDESLKEELVEGVESLQLYYGVDTDADTVPNLYLSADLLTSAQWQRVVSVRVGLLFQSETNAADVDQATNYTLLDNITLTHATADNTLRYAINSTVNLRNRGLPVSIANGLVCHADVDCE